jgi:ATP adenylyltransferase
VAAHTFVVMNLYPYNAGHVMIAPRRHVGSLAEATPEELVGDDGPGAAPGDGDGRGLHAGRDQLGLNLGKAAGAGVADHIHMHMVPRWVGTRTS